MMAFRMDEEARRKNREKQRRFQRRHPNYAKRPRATTKPGQYNVFELVDPRDPEQLPRVIAASKTSLPWANLWAVRRYSHAPWALWFQQLEQAGLEPQVVMSPWCARNMPRSVAQEVVKRRIDHICRCTTGGPLPAWLLRPSIFNRVAYLKDRHVYRLSIQEAAKIHPRIYTLVFFIRTDQQRRTWFDD